MDNNNKSNINGNHGGGHKGISHGLLMGLCCLLPILLIAGLPLFGFKGGSGFAFLAILICPLMHVGMMFMMRKSGKEGSCHGNAQNTDSNTLKSGEKRAEVIE